MILTPADPRHGTVNGYNNLGCRCPCCCAAHTAYAYVWRAARQARGVPPDDPRHGTVNGYHNLGCRCPRCRAANTLDARDKRQRR